MHVGDDEPQGYRPVWRGGIDGREILKWVLEK
jgi:hypothetical protein